MRPWATTSSWKTATQCSPPPRTCHRHQGSARSASAATFSALPNGSDPANSTRTACLRTCRRRRCIRKPPRSRSGGSVPPLWSRRRPPHGVDQGERTVTEQPMIGKFGCVELLAHHRLHRIPPQRNDCPVYHLAPPLARFAGVRTSLIEAVIPRCHRGLTR